ncbi:MAG: hypothetical protein R3E77_10155 [Steroidobacteraceae bacterium]
MSHLRQSGQASIEFALIATVLAVALFAPIAGRGSLAGWLLEAWLLYWRAFSLSISVN